MVAWPLLLEHFAALALVWAWAVLAGFALLPILRLRVGIAGAPLLGVVYWTVALYLLPFAGGLDIAAGLVVVLAAVAIARWWHAGAIRPVWTRGSWFTLILVIGSLPYLSTLLFHYVPFGMDASMHATAATLIGRLGGLPDSFAPFAPEVPFPAMNLGLPTLAGVAIRWGGEPAAVMLACHHLTFTLLILATYLLLRTWIQRTPAALLAVASVWMARASQASLEWGGFPTVASVAVGLFAARLLLQQGRMVNGRIALAAGAAVAAIPLMHGIGGGTWIYCVGIWVGLAALCASKNRARTLRGLAFTGLYAAVVLCAYRLAGAPEVGADDLANTRDFVRQFAPKEDGWQAWPAGLAFVRKDSGSVIVLAGWLACGVLALRRQWSAFLLVAGAWLTLPTIVANGQWYVLPGSFLLYPDRVIYWAAPLSAVALALAWRALPVGWRTPKFSAIGLTIFVLAVAGYSQNQFYQKIVREDFVNADGWEALVWAKEHLEPGRDFVATEYNSAGSFLPPIAQIGCTGSHHHHFIDRQVRAARQQRAVTHVLIDRDHAPAAVPAGAIVFRNRTITIVQMDPCGRGS